ncbi:MAG: CvpA family protein [Planctomycetota bacterium]|jgi:hypothetical protein
MLASLAVVLITLGCAAYLYVKGTFLKAFAMFIATICASVVAFGYFELLADFFISRSADSFNSLVPWAQPLSFVLLFVLAFAILQTVIAQLLNKPVDLGHLPESIGRVVCGVLLGFILSGLLLTTLAMAPLPNEYPYQRFDPDRPDPTGPSTALFNADGFATGWFAMLSGGSLSGQRSFNALHPDFLDQAFLNRLPVAEDVSVSTPSQAVEAPSRKQKAVWAIPEEIKDTLGQPLPQKRGHTLTFVRIGMKKPKGTDMVLFSFSQLRLICKETMAARNPAVGKARNVYPIGYMKTPDRLQISKLSDTMQLGSADFEDPVRWIDFAFHVPNDFQPVLIQFKQNSIAVLPPPTATEETPTPLPFVQLSKCPTDAVDLQTVRSAKLSGVRLATGAKFLSDLAVRIDDTEQWLAAQTSRSIKPAKFEDGRISHVRAELKVRAIAEKKTEEPKSKRPSKKKTKRRPRPRRPARQTQGIRKMLKPMQGYKLLSLSCNSPETGSPISAEELPVLIELTGAVHHPVGVIASGRVDDENICEVDYCGQQVAGGLVLAKDGTVAKPFPDSVWLTEKAQKIIEFYVLYLVEADRDAIITGVKPAGAKVPAQFKKAEGLLVK